MGVYITARISTTEQEESGLGMESQITECTRYAQDHGLGLPTAVFTDCITRKSDVYSRPGLPLRSDRRWASCFTPDAGSPAEGRSLHRCEWRGHRNDRGQ